MPPRLSMDLGGNYGQSRDSLQHDLIVLRQSVDDLQQQIASQLTTINALSAQLAQPALSVAANGQVAGLPGGGLRTVTHDATMFGQGTPASPLRANTALILSGISSSPVSVATLAIASKATFTGWGASYAAGTTIVAGVSGKHILPLVWGVNWVEAGNNAFNPWTAVGGFRIANNAAGNAGASDLTGFANSAFDGDEGGIAFGSGRLWSANVGNNTPRGSALKIYTTAGWTANGSSSMTMTGSFFVLYQLAPM